MIYRDWSNKNREEQTKQKSKNCVLEVFFFFSGKIFSVSMYVLKWHTWNASMSS